MGGSKYSVGVTKRPEFMVGQGSGKIYNVGGNILKNKGGKTMGLLIEVPKNKDQQYFPFADRYTYALPRTDRDIINYRSKRSEIKNEAVEKYPGSNLYTP